MLNGNGRYPGAVQGEPQRKAWMMGRKLQLSLPPSISGHFLPSQTELFQRKKLYFHSF